jgi:hypothetical protein
MAQGSVEVGATTDEIRSADRPSRRARSRSGSEYERMNATERGRSIRGNR